MPDTAVLPTAMTVQQPNAMEMLAELMRKTDDPGVSMAIAKAAVDLQIQMEKFNWEREERQAKIDFDNALSKCQSKIERIAPNQGRKSSKDKPAPDIFWLDYVRLDSVMRPVYLAEGFSISFSEMEEYKEGYVGMTATLSRGGVSREYRKRLTTAAAFAGMPKADAEASAASRVKRYLMLQIFNIAVGIDADEKAPYGISPELADKLKPLLDTMRQMATMDDLKDAYQKAFKVAQSNGDALKEVVDLNEKLKNELRGHA